MKIIKPKRVNLLAVFFVYYFSITGNLYALDKSKEVSLIGDSPKNIKSKIVSSYKNMASLSDKSLSLITGEASIETDLGNFYIESDDSRISDLITVLPVKINSLGRTINIFVEDLTITSVTGGVSWGDTDGDGSTGSQMGVFTAFSHLPDIIHVDMTAPVEIEPKFGIIKGFNETEVAYLEQRIPGITIEIEKFTKVLALTDKMVTDPRLEKYKPGDLDPYSGRVINVNDDPNNLLDNPYTSVIDPQTKFAGENEILGTYFSSGGKITTCGGLDENGNPDINKPGRVYVFVH